MIDICYVISHGFAARMLFQTGLVLKLTQEGKKVALIAPDLKDANLDEFRSNENVSLYELSDNKNLWSENYQFKRPYFLEDIKSNTALWEKHINAIFYSGSKHPWRRVRPFYYYSIHQLIKVFPRIKENFILHEKKYLESKVVENLLKEINPRLVVSTYPVSLLEARVLYEARKQNIPRLIHLLSWDNILCKGIFPVDADYYIVWGEIMLEELIAYYQPNENNVYVCGVPHFDQHIQVREHPNYQNLLSDFGLDSDLPFLFFAMSAPRFTPREIEIVEWLANKVEQGHFGNDLQLIVRPHPQNVSGFMADRSWLKRLDRLKSKKVAIDYPQLVNSKMRWSLKKRDMEHLSNLLVGCSICINSGSTVSIDALMVDKPVILTSFDGKTDLSYWHSARRLADYPHLKKLIGLGAVQSVDSYDNFERVISKYLEEPNHDLAVRQQALLKECYKNDGKSTVRVKDSMLDILRSIEKMEDATIED